METKIAAELIDELRRRRMTVGTAESCTAGMISAEIADVPLLKLSVLSPRNVRDTWRQEP